jgi:hypothetical protein
LGEALTNLYVGLGRYWRGEKLSAARFIQGYAVDRVLQLIERITPEAGVPRDSFVIERRFERRFPSLALALPGFIQGYARSPESAAAAFLERHFDVDAALAGAIRELIADPARGER